MLNLFLAAAAIALCFPFGVLLAVGRVAGGRMGGTFNATFAAIVLALLPIALYLLLTGGSSIVSWATLIVLGIAAAMAFGGWRLGRRSKLPLVRAISVGYIELFRGVPLYVMLLLTYLAVGFMLQPLSWLEDLCSIVLCFPLGVLLALGRRSSLPIVRGLSTAYIEIVRGAPLFVLLLLANVALQFFIPADRAPATATRAIAVFTLFTAAYMAEIVRGGLQSVPRGQYEAAKALGLSPTRQTALIVLPQALRNVIPAQIGQLISLFKDTSLAGAAMGLFELIEVSTVITQQGEFRGQGLIGETIAFAALMFWTVSYTMSRESQRLERRLGVGTR